MKEVYYFLKHHRPPESTIPLREAINLYLDALAWRPNGKALRTALLRGHSSERTSPHGRKREGANQSQNTHDQDEGRDFFRIIPDFKKRKATLAEMEASPAPHLKAI
jgi:hypothetical protein